MVVEEDFQLILPLLRLLSAIHHCLSLADCGRGLGSSGVTALDTMKPVTAPMTMTGIRSLCPPNNPNRRAIVKGAGRKAHATPAIPASTPTPCGMNVRISVRSCPSVPPINSNGKIGPPSKPVANDVPVSKILTSIISSNIPTPYGAGL